MSNITEFIEKDFVFSDEIIYAQPSPQSYLKCCKIFEQLLNEEKKCFHCSRMNDMFVAKCWWCQVKDPTKEI
jgi:hypothetical protein